MKYVMYTNFGRLVRENGFRDALKIAKSIGFLGVEIADSALTAEKSLVPSVEVARDYRKILEEEKMEIACYSVGLTLYQAPEVTNALKMHAEIAAALGSPYLHHTLCLGSVVNGKTPNYDEVLADVVPRAVEVARYCRDLGLTCIYEDQGPFFNGIDGFGTFLREMKAQCDNVGVCCDFGNIMFADCGASEFISAFFEDIKHVHLKDYLKTSEKDDREGRWHTTKKGDYLLGVPTGEGSVDFAAGLRLLKNAGYDGYFAFEQELTFPEPFIADTKHAMVYLDGMF